MPEIQDANEELREWKLVNMFIPVFLSPGVPSQFCGGRVSTGPHSSEFLNLCKYPKQVCFRTSLAHQASVYLWFPQHKMTENIHTLPHGWDASPSQAAPQLMAVPIYAPG